MPHEILMPHEITLERIKNLFESAMIPFEDCKPNCTPKTHFHCLQDSFHASVYVDPENKIISFVGVADIPIKNHQWSETHWKLLMILNHQFSGFRMIRMADHILCDHEISCRLGVYGPSIIDAFRLFCRSANTALDFFHAICVLRQGGNNTQFVHLPTDDIDQLMAMLIGNGSLPDDPEETD